MPVQAEKRMVPGFEHRPGHHCGSTALRNLLAFHGADVSEELAFGLGAGACFFFVSAAELSPSRFTNGRTGRLEESFLELTGAPLRLRTEEDPGRAWELAREVVDAGRPALLITDLYHLDYYGNSAHFPGHAVVLAGYDGERAYLADTAFAELQATSLASLAEARHGRHPFYPLAGHMVDVPGPPPNVDGLRAAAPAAIERAAREMLEPGAAGGEPGRAAVQGLPALRRLAEEIGSWPEVADDWRWCARFTYQVIERRGTGGGNFRSLYGRFLDEVGRPEAAAASARAAALWSELAAQLHAASEEDDPDPARWAAIGAGAERIAEAEQRLWEQLARPRTAAGGR